MKHTANVDHHLLRVHRVHRLEQPGAPQMACLHRHRQRIPPQL